MAIFPASLLKNIIQWGLAASLLIVAGCQSSGGKVTSFTVASETAIGAIMPKIARLAARCWTARSKPMAAYRVSSELNSLSGQPRILLVARRSTQGLPALVVLGQAAGKGTQLSIFGPLLSEPKINTLVRDNLNAWKAGSASCSDRS